MAVMLVFPSLKMQDAWEKACGGKLSYPSENAALTTARLFGQGKLARVTRKRDSEWDCFWPYRCSFCGEWHLGHKHE